MEHWWVWVVIIIYFTGKILDESKRINQQDKEN